MPYIDSTKAQQIIAIAKDYIGTQYYSLLMGENNGYKKDAQWNTLLCFYELYRLAKHRPSDFINDSSYQSIIQYLLSKIALTPNYSLATCNTNVIVANGGCGCGGGTTTTGNVAGCVDSVLPFSMAFGQTSYQHPSLVGAEILIVLRNGIAMSLYASNIQGFIFDTVTGTFIPNSAISEQGEDFIILSKNCSGGGSPIIPIIGLFTGVNMYSGDGVTRTFNIVHGLFPFTPGWYVVGDRSPGGAGVFTYLANSVSITITFDVAPPIGSNNIILPWAARY